MSEDKLTLYVDVWKKAVETQMHFNEMSAKSRQLGLSFVAGALGVAVVLLGKNDDFWLQIACFRLHVSILIILGAALSVAAVRTLDLRVYHRMLRGAVAFGEDFERNYLKQLFTLDKGMTEAISHFSRHGDAKCEQDATGKNKYTGTDMKTAEENIRRFYRLTTMGMVIIAVVLFVVTNLATRKTP